MNLGYTNLDIAVFPERNQTHPSLEPKTISTLLSPSQSTAAGFIFMSNRAFMNSPFVNAGDSFVPEFR